MNVPKLKRTEAALAERALVDHALEPEQLAKEARRTILRLVHRTRSPHIGSAFSTVEALIALYYGFLRVSPGSTRDPDRDRFILSKGHACAALYSVLAMRGFMDAESLDGFAVDGGLLEHHPCKDLDRGIEITTGSLGHGLSIGAGMALAGRLDGRPYRVCVLLGDGELNEGSVWEAVMFAGHQKLGNLIALVDSNRMQALGCTRDIIDLDPIADKWRGFGWSAVEVDGHSIGEITAALHSLTKGEGPAVIVLRTVKGKGVSFMEDKLLWHYRAPDEDEYARALAELSG